MRADSRIDGPGAVAQTGTHEGRDESKLTFQEAVHGAVNNRVEELGGWDAGLQLPAGGKFLPSLREPQLSNLDVNARNPGARGERRQHPSWASAGLVYSRECPSKVTPVRWVPNLPGLEAG